MGDLGGIGLGEGDSAFFGQHNVVGWSEEVSLVGAEDDGFVFEEGKEGAGEQQLGNPCIDSWKGVIKQIDIRILIQGSS